MKKTALIIISVLLLLLLLLYTLLFTSPGNALLRPVIESKINENSPLKITLATFVLRTDSLKLLLTLDEENSFAAEGVYSLFSQSFDIDYRLELTRLSNLSETANRQLSGRLMSGGKASGDLNLFKIKGKSDLAQSTTDYALIVQKMELDKAALKLSNLDIEELMNMAGEKPYAHGKIDLHVQLYDLSTHDMNGTVLLDLKEARLNGRTLKDEFGLNLSKTALKSQLKATLQGEKLEYRLSLDSELAILLSEGEMELEHKSVDVRYKIDIKELALLKSITKTPLRGALFTEGHISGNEEELLIKGSSDIASSQSTYEISLSQLKLSRALVQIKNGSLQKLLYMAEQSNFADGRINADIELLDLNPKNLKGKASLTLSEGRFKQKVMEKEFDITLPPTNFELHTSADLQAENIRYSFLLNSNLAHIQSSGDVVAKDMKTEALYAINIKELGLLKPLTGAPLRGPFATSGTISGDNKALSITGKSDLADSKTAYSLLLKDLVLNSAKATVLNAELSKLLYLAGENSYARGKVGLDLDMASATPLKAKIKFSLSQGVANAKAIQKDFNITLPYTSFELKSEADIANNLLVASSRLDSNLATLTLKKSTLHLDSAALASDYRIVIPSLESLESILERKLYGAVTLSGNVKKDTKLTLTAHSDIFKGRLNATLVDEQLNADFKDLRAIEVLKMLGYPDVMDAPINGTLSYNSKSEKGRLQVRFDKALLTRSKFTEIIRQFSQTDLSKEHFNEGTLVSDINKEIITSDLQMQSKEVSLRSKKFVINSKKQLIDARFGVKVKAYPGDIIVVGNINAPKVSLDAKSMITPEIKEKMGKEVNRFLKKLF